MEFNEILSLIQENFSNGNTVDICSFSNKKKLFSGFIEQCHACPHMDSYGRGMICEFKLRVNENSLMSYRNFDCSMPYRDRTPLYLKIDEQFVKMYFGFYEIKDNFFNNQQPEYFMGQRQVIYDGFILSRDCQEEVKVEVIEPILSRWEILDIR